MDRFFRSNRAYAVIGASQNPNKFGYKVFKWYRDHGIPSVPVNPNRKPVLDTPTVKSLQDVPLKTGYDLAISVITPPNISKTLIETIQDLPCKVQAIWFQPGSHTPEIINLARTKVPIVVTDCILVNGDKYYSLSKL